MTIERQAPDAIIPGSLVGFTGGDITSIDDDPDSPDANWLNVGGANNVNTDVRVSFPTPSAALTNGAGLQEFRVQVRKTAHSTNPTCTVELWEAGALVSTLISAVPVTTTGAIVLSGLWDATGRTAASIECRVVGTVGGGSPGNRASLEVGAIEWNADITAGGPATVSPGAAVIAVATPTPTVFTGTPIPVGLVVGDAAALTAGDTKLQSILTGAGYDVTLISDDAAYPGAGVHDLYFQSESCSPGTLATKYTGIAEPVVSCEVGGWDNLGMTTQGSATDGGSSATWDLEAHEITTGLSDPLTVFTAANPCWGVADTSFGAGVEIFARHPTTASHILGFCYDEGSTLADSSTAAARLVALGISNGTAPNVSTDFETLMLNAVEWALGAAGGTPATVSPPAAVVDITTPIPTVTAGTKIPATVAPPAAIVDVATPTPTITAGSSMPATVSPPTAEFLVSTPTPTVTAGTKIPATVSPPAATFDVSTAVPEVKAAATVSPPAAIVDLVTPVPSVEAGSVTTVEAPPALASAHGLPPSVSGGAVVSPPAAVIDVSTPTPTVAGGSSGTPATVSPPAAIITVTTPTPELAAAATIEAAAALFELVTPTPTISNGTPASFLDVTADALEPVIKSADALDPESPAPDALEPTIVAQSDALDPESPAPDANEPATIRPAADPEVVRPAADPETVDHAQEPVII